jgi:hypothetical protein
MSQAVATNLYACKLTEEGSHRVANLLKHQKADPSMRGKLQQTEKKCVCGEVKTTSVPCLCSQIVPGAL